LWDPAGILMRTPVEPIKGVACYPPVDGWDGNSAVQVGNGNVQTNSFNQNRDA
jgi:hypothetical protein